MHMEPNIFVADPITVVIWHNDATGKHAGEWQASVKVIIQNASAGTRVELDKIMHAHNAGGAVRDSRVLREVYGTRWRERLGLTAPVRGGAADDDDLDSAELNALVRAIDSDAVDVDGESTFEPVTSERITARTLHVPREHVHTSLARLEYVYDFTVFPDDRAMEFRQKINLHFKIPLFRQHVWFQRGSITYTLRYQMLYGGVPRAVTIARAIWPPANQSMLAGIPVDQSLYDNKDMIKIEAYDNFTTMSVLYHRYAATVYNVVDLESFVGPHRNKIRELGRSDSDLLYYSFVLPYFPMLNTAAFLEYIDERSLVESYPEIDPPASGLLFVHAQDRLVQQTHALHLDSARVRAVDAITQASLTMTTMKVTSAYKNKIINFRLLFDMLEVSTKVDSIKFYDVWKGRRMVFDKTHVGSARPLDRLEPHTIMFRVIITHTPMLVFQVRITNTGTYTISGVWPKESRYTFTDINHLAEVHVSPLIARINSMPKVMYHVAYRLPVLSKATVRFNEISLSVFWKRTLTSQQFKHLRTVLDGYVNARMLSVNSLEKTSLKYFFKRGMYDFDPQRIEKSIQLDNYYAYLVNVDVRKSWEKIFELVRLFVVTHRFSDVEFTITGIKQDEYASYMAYVYNIIDTFTHESKTRKYAVDTGARETKLLNNLKEQDPVLFDYHKSYDTQKAYSVACQQKFQPLLLNEPQYQQLDRASRASVVEYWNFTTSGPAYYKCPNPKYPYLKFITGKHPLGYCLPCCKKTPPPDNPSDKQRIVYDTCLGKHSYTKAKDIESNSRYIMTYGKTIEPGRISQLPEDSLEPLLSDTRADDGDDGGRLFEARYYLYGVKQSSGRFSNVGYMYCLANAVDHDLAEFIVETITLVRERPHLFELLLTGRITRYFATSEQLVRALGAFTGTPHLVSHTTEDFTMWNELFIDIAFFYYKIHTIVFRDRNGNVKLQLPEYLTNAEDYQFVDHLHLVVLQNSDTRVWNPVYVINKNSYNKNHSAIEKKLYKYKSETIQRIMTMIDDNFKHSLVQERLTFDLLRKYLLAHPKKHIEKILVTRDNLCYAVVLSDVGYVPVHMTIFKYDESTPVSLDVQAIDRAVCSIDRLQQFRRSWYEWVLDESRRAGSIRAGKHDTVDQRIQPIYPVLEIEEWLVYRTRVIGYQSNGLNWYIVPIDTARAVRLANVRLQKLYYDPMAVNRALALGAGDSDYRTRNITSALYQQYSYQLLVMELTNYFSTQLNTRLRLEIKKYIVRYATGAYDIEHLFAHITDTVVHAYGRNNELVNSDIARLKTLIADIVNTGGDKRDLLIMLDAEMFNFDKVLLENLKRLPVDRLRVELDGIVMKLVKPVTNPRITDFGNLLQICNAPGATNDYCDKRRLVVDRAKLPAMIDIIAAQIKNPFVQKYIFSPLFSDSVIDYFKFTRRPYEIITLSYVTQ